MAGKEGVFLPIDGFPAGIVPLGPNQSRGNLQYCEKTECECHVGSCYTGCQNGGCESAGCEGGS